MFGSFWKSGRSLPCPLVFFQEEGAAMHSVHYSDKFWGSEAYGGSVHVPYPRCCCVLLLPSSLSSSKHTFTFQVARQKVENQKLQGSVLKEEKEIA